MHNNYVRGSNLDTDEANSLFLSPGNEGSATQDSITHALGNPALNATNVCSFDR